MRKDRKFYTLEQKQTIMRHIQRFKPVSKDPSIELYSPDVEDFTKDIALMMDFIFTYEFKTLNIHLEKDTIKGAPSEIAASAVGSQSQIIPANPYLVEGEVEVDFLKIATTPIYRDQENFPPKKLENCVTWWDVVVFRFYNDLASVTFMVNN